MPCSNTKNNLWDDVFLSVFHYCIIAAEFVVDFPMPNPPTSVATDVCQDSVTSVSTRNVVGPLVKVEAVGQCPQGQQTPLAVLQMILQQLVMNKLEPHQNLSVVA